MLISDVKAAILPLTLNGKHHMAFVRGDIGIQPLIQWISH